MVSSGSSRRRTSSPAPRRRGTRSPTRCRSTTPIRPEFEGAVPTERPALDPPPPGVVRGSCLCGDVAFELRGKPLRMTNCHCSRCRRGRSAAHATNLVYPLDAFTLGAR